MTKSTGTQVLSIYSFFVEMWFEFTQEKYQCCVAEITVRSCVFAHEYSVVACAYGLEEVH